MTSAIGTKRTSEPKPLHVRYWGKADIARPFRRTRLSRYDTVSLLERGMRRREFLGVLGGAATWSFAARAQQPSKLRTIGFLGAATPSATGLWTAAFVQRVRELGWIEGRTVAIEYRWAEGQSQRFAEIADELVRTQGRRYPHALN